MGTSEVKQDIFEGENYQAWNIESLSTEQQGDFRLLAENLVGYAILAATTHNVQGWKFSVDEKGKQIGIHVDPEKILPESDKTGRQSYIGTGCALANLEVAARHYGLEPDVEYLPTEEDPYFSVRVQLGRNSESKGDDGLFEAITRRRVNRSEYDPQKKISQEVIQEIRQHADNDPDLGLRLIEDRMTVNAIAQIQEQGDLIVLNTDRFRQELADFLLPNDTVSGVGMPGHNFGLSEETAQKLHQQLKSGGRLDHDLSRGFAVADAKGIRTSPALGVIAVSQDNPLHWIKAGRAWQMMALAAEKHCVNMAINAALVEVDLLNTGLKLRLRTNKRPTMVFRMGYATEDRPHSPRRALKEVVVFQSTFKGES